MRFSPQMRDLKWLVAKPIAHRGLHDASKGIVENCESAFALAIKHGYAIECDIELTKDGEAVVFHDDEIDRLMDGKGMVKTFTTTELKQKKYRQCKDKIQTLDELLEQVDGRSTLVIEIKSLWDEDMALTHRALDMLADYNGPYALMSFDPHIVACVAERSPATVRGITADRVTDPYYNNLSLARRLEMQGKQEQADLIKQNILGNQKTPWTPITMAELQTLMVEALNPEAFNKKAKDRLFDFALVYNNTDIFEKLVVLKYRRAEKPEAERSSIMRRSYAQYAADDVKKVTENIKKYGLDYRDEFNMTPLLAALKTGATKVIDFLLAQDANQNVTDNLGINPFQMALQQAHSNTKFLQTRLPELYHKLQPDHIKIKLEGHLVKVSARSMAFFLLQNFLVTQTPILEQRDNNLKDNGLTMDDIMDFVEKFDIRILPEFRQKRQYVNSIMAKNEIDGKDVYNKKLFLRLGRGVYVVNPDLDIQIADGEWLNVYTLMNTEKMTREHNEALKAEAHKIQQDERQAAILKWQKQREAERKRVESERFDKFGNWNW